MASAIGMLGYHGNQRKMWASGGTWGKREDSGDKRGQHGGPSKLGGGLGAPGPQKAEIWG